ncbi:MAG: S-layer homology domain-containing protein [Tissierellia bacterium]|nr:S-layer homology domain-containing protein [Tissierellia bacterium]
MKEIKNKLVAVTLALSLMLAQGSNVMARSFSDTRGHWSAPYVNTLSDMGILSGYGDGDFRPDASITKAEFYAMVNKAAGYSKTYTVTFTDVNGSHWFYNDVAKAIKAGYIQPTTGALNPNRAISRQEAMRIFAYIYNITDSESYLNRFTDRSSITAAARPGVAAMISHGIVGGYEDGSFRPNRSITRGEVAKIFSVLIDLYGNPPNQYVLDSQIRFGPKKLYE